MSRTISIIKCEGCGRELGRHEEGEPRNPNGTIGYNTEIMSVNYSLCSHCNPKDKKHG